MLSRKLTPEPKWVIVGTLMAILPDLDALIPGIDHHGPMHTPLFALLICASLGGALSKRMPVIVCAMGILSHLVLDTIVSESGLMWLYPQVDAPTSLGLGLTIPVIVILRVFLFSIPLVWMIERCQKHGEGFLDIIIYLRGVIGPWWTTVSTASASVIIVAGVLLGILPGAL
jgi:hypothetical protein